MIDFSVYPLNAEDSAELSKLDIDMVFQPIFNAEDLAVFAYEALMRPKGKTPLALIDEYKKQNKLSVIEVATCIGAAQEFIKRGYTQKLCINSLPSEVLTKEQAEVYYSSFPEIRGRVVVEILEHTLPDEKSWVAKKNFIVSHGTSTALDDYSTGFNDREAVKYFEPQYVKLDRELISDIDADTNKQHKLRDMVCDFHRQGIRVIAEGIETKGELEYLRANTDVDYFQGYYLGMPQ